MYEDFLQGGLDLSPVPDDRISEVSGDPDAIFVTRLALYYYGMKVDRPPFDDARVRQALNYAVDRQDIVENVAAGYQVVAEGPIPPGMQGYDPPIPDYSYDPTRALDLLAQAGWTDTDFDGVLDKGPGSDLEIELMHNTSDGHSMIAQFIQQCLQDIGGAGLGARVTVSDTDSSTYYDNLDTYPFFRMGWLPDYPDIDNFVSPLFHSAGEQNYTHYADPEVDAWLEQARTTIDGWTTRRSMIEQIETKVLDDAPILSLFYPGKVYVQSEDVLGLVIPPWRLDFIQMEKVQLSQNDHDVMVQAILYPKESVLAGEPMTPVVKVRNAGRYDEENVTVRCRILQGGTEVYDETWTISLLGTSDTWSTSGPYDINPSGVRCTIECSTLLPGDEDTSNDLKSHDFAVTEDAFYDAYIRDNAVDDGSICTDLAWQSPDIWNRHQRDGVHRHQDPILGQTNYVYVRVRNIGNTPIPGGTLEFYYHDPSAAIRCGDWALLGDIDPTWFRYDDFTVWTAWVPHRTGHTCLLARFSSPGDPVSAECDVACDNNLAQRNVEVVTLDEAALARRPSAGSGQTSATFEVGNPYDLPAPVDLIVERGTFPATGTLELEFSRALFARWQDAGGIVQGGVAVPDTARISVTHPVSTTVFSLPLGVRETQQARMYLAGPVGAEFDLHVSERIHSHVVGGITYHTPIPWTIYLPLVLKGHA